MVIATGKTMSETKIHMVCGSTGAGKTTYSMKLENALPAVRFSIDEWMMELFWPDASPETTFDWAYGYYATEVMLPNATAS